MESGSPMAAVAPCRVSPSGEEDGRADLVLVTYYSL